MTKDNCSASLQGVALAELQLEFLIMPFFHWQHEKKVFVVTAAANKKLFTFEKLSEKKFLSTTTIAMPTGGKKNQPTNYTNQAIQNSVAYFDEILPLKKQRS